VDSSLPPSISDRVKEVIALLCVAALITLCVIGKFDNALVFDDVGVVGGDLIHDPSRMGEVFVGRTMIAHGPQQQVPASMDTYRPIPLLTFFWDAHVSGHEPWAYHLTNHLLHLGVALGVYLLARTLLPSSGMWVALLVAAFFGLSPQLGEGHVWINGRSDPLAALFGVFALWVWSGWTSDLRRVSGRPFAVFLLTLLGLMSKEVLLVGLASCLVWPLHRDRSLTWRIGRSIPFAAAAVVYLGARVSALGGARVAYGPEQLGVALRNLPLLWTDGLRELVLPSRLYLRSMRDEYALWSDTERVAAAAFVLVLSLAVWLLRKRSPVLVWGSAWFALTLAPAAMISAVLWPGFGRYLYLPCVGLALSLGEATQAVIPSLKAYFGVERAEVDRKVTVLIGAVATVYLASLALRLATFTVQYADNETLYANAIEASPAPAYAYAWLGTHFVTERDAVRGTMALQKAVELDPREPRYLHDLARARLVSGDVVTAERELRGAIARAPKHLVGDLRALLVYAIAGRDPRAAVAELCTCLQHQPDLVDCRGTLGPLLDPRGPAYPQLREEIAVALATHPSPVARGALEQALKEQGLYDRVR